MKRGEAVFHKGAETAHTWQSGFKNGKSDRSPTLTDPPAQPPKCPECTSQKVWKDGLRYTKQGEIQRWLCRACGYRFSEHKIEVNVTSQFGKTSHSRKNVSNLRIGSFDLPREEKLNRFDLSCSENVSSHDSSSAITSIAKPLKALPCYNSKRQVCVSEREAKNLSKVESRTEKRAAGATRTKPTLADVKGKIVHHLFWLKKNGYKESTIRTRSYHLRTLVRLGANLLDPESVKETIAKLQVKEDTKAQYAATYHVFTLQNGIVWDPPRYRQHQKIPFIPTEAEVDQLIAAGGKKTSTLLQLLKETAMRIGEAWRLKWTDIDFERKIIILNDPEKNSKARIFNVSNKLIAMLRGLPKKSEKVFGYVSLHNKKHDFLRFRKRLAQRLQNPRIVKISYHIFRHWKATTLYHETKDILYVMEFLGHRDIRNTMRYIQLEKALFNSGNDQFHVKVAKNVEEACALVEVGFDYITGSYNDGGKIFRKRK